MKIGNVELSGNIVLAPLAGFTDFAFRGICRRFGAALSYTEMISAKGLCYNNENTARLLRLADNEKPSAVQFFGSEPDFIAEAIKRTGFDIVDINMGCPVPKIVRNGEGSALMTRPDTAERVVSAAVRAGKAPVTVKFRKGFDCVNAVEFAKRMEGAGASALAVHGRTREQYYSGEADWEIIAKVASAVKIPVIGNGDVVDKESYDKAMKTGVAGVMIGRGALGSPWIFAELTGKDVIYNRFDIIREHMAALCAVMPESLAVNEMKKHVSRYLKGFRGANAYNGEIYSAREISELYAVIQKAEDSFTSTLKR